MNRQVVDKRRHAMPAEHGQPGVAFVTGASAGFGAAIAHRLVARGVRVVAAARRVERLDELASEFGRDFVLPLALDVRDRSAVQRAVADLPPAFTEARPAGWRGRTRVRLR
jgi:3-hydroxy acid dehydrogenase/malonic semialdehyde reductase